MSPKAELPSASAAIDKYLPQVRILYHEGEDPSEIMRALDVLLVINGVPDKDRQQVGSEARKFMGIDKLR